jgi:hypothetical protein
MFSNLFFNLLNISTKLASFFGVIPIEFSQKTKRFSYNPSLQRRHYFSTFGFIGLTCFSLFRTFQTYLAQKRDGKINPYFHVCVAVCYACIIASIAIVVLFQYQHNISNILNRNLEYANYFQSEFIK